MRVADLRKLQVFDHQCLRRILHVRWQQFISNDEIRSRCNSLSIAQIILMRRLRWFGHALRRQPGAFIREAIDPAHLLGWKNDVVDK